MAYDPAGRMATMTYHDSFDYDGANLTVERDWNTGAITRRYVHGPGIDEPLVRYDGTGTSTRSWYHADERGSVIALSNGSGTVTNVNAYDEYGIPASGNTGRFQYTGLPWLPQLGMQNSRNRIYSTTLGRFMQTDPIGVAGGINLYGYVLNDPVNWTDPLGLSRSCGRRRGPDLVTWDNDNNITVQAQWNEICWDSEEGSGWSPWQIMGDVGPGNDSPPSPICQELNQRVEQAKTTLPARVLMPNVWNNYSNLAFFHALYAENASHSGVASALVAIGSAIASITPLGRGYQIASGLGGGGASYGLTRQQAYYQRIADGIKARMDQMRHQRNGSQC